MDDSMIKKDTFIKIKNNMSNLKNNNIKLEKEINNIISKSTKNEKDNFDKAFIKYQNAMKTSLNSTEVKHKLDEKCKCEEKIDNLMNNIQKALRKAIKEINNLEITDVEKKDKILALQNSIEDAIMSDDEKLLMKSLKNYLGNNCHFRTIHL
tara:strand:+ start:1158 stop:1613 length:456 start_codon:yes stop_codon:yes gene_type:complete